MNSLKGKITAVQVHGQLSLVHVQAGDTLLKSIVIETPASAPTLKEGCDIQVLFKETEVIIGTGREHFISLQNRLSCTIRHLEKGKLLCKLHLHHTAAEIVSVITTAAVEQLHLKVGDVVTAMIKTNEIMLSE